MILLQPQQDAHCDQYQAFSEKIQAFVEDQKRFAVVLYRKSNSAVDDVLAQIGEKLHLRGGQFLSLDTSKLSGNRLSGQLLAALEGMERDRSFRINLPLILQDHPDTESPFINRAIIWQRLCDRIIEDEEPQRPTLTVLKNLGLAVDSDRHELARLIRFHNNHRLRRTFIATIRQDCFECLGPELEGLVDKVVEL